MGDDALLHPVFDTRARRPVYPELKEILQIGNTEYTNLRAVFSQFACGSGNCSAAFNPALL
jgi:hypothetical protein